MCQILHISKYEPSLIYKCILIIHAIRRYIIKSKSDVTLEPNTTESYKFFLRNQFSNDRSSHIFFILLMLRLIHSFLQWNSLDAILVFDYTPPKRSHDYLAVKLASLKILYNKLKLCVGSFVRWWVFSADNIKTTFGRCSKLKYIPRNMLSVDMKL